MVCKGILHCQVCSIWNICGISNVQVIQCPLKMTITINLHSNIYIPYGDPKTGWSIHIGSEGRVKPNLYVKMFAGNSQNATNILQANH